MKHKKPSLPEYGPEYVLTVHDARLGMEGFLVIHNTALGPGKGGIRMTPDITVEEVGRLAETMTWKNAIAGVPFGGAKAGIRWEGGSDEKKKAFVQSFARAIRPFLVKKYIAGPDVATGEREMQWFAEAVGRWQVTTGKPARYCMITADGEKCGIPHEVGSTGFGVARSAATAAEAAGMSIKGAHIAIHGFGNVGTFAFRHLAAMGAKIIALADHNGAVFVKDGFAPKLIERMIAKRISVALYPKGRRIAPDKFWAVPTDILIPASVTDVITDKNKHLIRTRLIVEGGNIPMREPIEAWLFRKGTMIVPDFVANAGGVISSYAEYKGFSVKRMFELVEQKITASTRMVTREALRTKINPRTIAREIAEGRVYAAMNKRERTFK